MTVPDLQSLAQLFTGRLLNTAAEGIVLAGLVWVLLRLIGRQNSGTRFAIWFSALLAIVALPFLSGSGFGASHSQALASREPARRNYSFKFLGFLSVCCLGRRCRFVASQAERRALACASNPEEVLRSGPR